MTTDYTGNPDNDPSFITEPDDSDDWTADILNAPAEALADSIAHLRRLVNSVGAAWAHNVEEWSGPSVVGNGAPTTSTVNVVLPPNVLGVPSANLIVNVSGNEVGFTDGGSGGALLWKVELPAGVTLNHLTFYGWNLAYAGGGSFQIIKENAITGACTNLGSAVTVPAGTLDHTGVIVPATDLTEVIDSAYHYYVSQTVGAGSAAWTGVVATITENGSYVPLRVPPVWDPAMGRWLVGLTEGGSSGILQSFDGHAFSDWSGPLVVSSHGYDVLGILPRSTDGIVLVVAYDLTASAGVTFVISPTGALTTHTASPFVARASNSWSSGTWLPTPAVWVAWAGGSTVAPYSSPDGTTWTAAASWAPPVSGFVVHNQASFAATFLGSFTAFIFPAGVEGTNPVDHFAYSLDGTTWAFAAMPAAMPSGDAIVDACFDPTTSTIYLATGTTTQTRIWSTQSFTGWSPSPIATIPHQCYGLAAAGGALTLWARFAGQGPALGNIYRPIRSTDNGGTWSAPIGTGTATAPGNYFSLASSPGQVFYSNSTEYVCTIGANAPPTGVV